DWTVVPPGEEEVEAALERSQEPETPYLFPRHPDEVDRLDLQHFALRETLGANFLAPVESPVRVLDVGTGTGQWGIEVCWEHPEALVVGFDLVAGRAEHPSGYRHVRGNLLQGLPFREGSFDFVHQRLLTWGVPVAAWPGVVAELVRVTRPGGWVELAEVTRPQQTGPATQAFFDLIHQHLAVPLDLDVTDIVFRSLDEYLRRAGLEEVARREVVLPVGEWGGQVGTFMATDFRTGGARLCEVMQTRSSSLAEEAKGLLSQAMDEFDQHRTIFPVAVAYGCKPA
ncbi:MAG TPA: class I SAM-dependent methyltransferase, partial [Candidatus Dormibacteraeota bacterium]|nr:class I SAM-dependent methyltransferase [Candidatus Dormibacteraeota bacterium]